MYQIPPKIQKLNSTPWELQKKFPLDCLFPLFHPVLPNPAGFVLPPTPISINPFKPVSKNQSISKWRLPVNFGQREKEKRGRGDHSAYHVTIYLQLQAHSTVQRSGLVQMWPAPVPADGGFRAPKVGQDMSKGSKGGGFLRAITRPFRNWAPHIALFLFSPKETCWFKSTASLTNGKDKKPWF